MKTMSSDVPRLYAIGDLHLPGGSDKPMHVFGDHWEDHFVKISNDWLKRVRDEDIVLIPGDISWAMQLQDAAADLAMIAALPGKKVMIRGNHDYWWGSIGKLRAALPIGFYALQNDALYLDGLVFCGSRGWTNANQTASQEDQRIYQRELGRMELSLRAADRLAPGEQPIVLTHYPPTDESGAETKMTDLFSRFAVRDVVYGHLHGQAGERAFSGLIGNVRYHPVSCDGLGFRLYRVPLDPAPVL